MAFSPNFDCRARRAAWPRDLRCLRAHVLCLSWCFSASSSASPRLRVKITLSSHATRFPGFPSPSTTSSSWQRALRFLCASSALPRRSLRLRVKSPPSLSKTLRSHFPLCTKLAIVKYFIALASLACAAACAAVLPPYELECEARRNPVGIDAPQPRLSWKLRAERQSDHQI